MTYDNLNAYRLGSLFSGIGGFELGFEATNQFKTVFQVEINPFCRKILEKHWKDVPRFENVKTVGKHNLPACDILVGGFPCQDISSAGNGAGLEGARSGLWWEMHRIIGELRPRVVVVENVSALAIRGLNTIIGSLSQIRYDSEWQIVSAASVGAPHLRERYFIVAYPSSESSESSNASQHYPQISNAPSREFRRSCSPSHVPDSQSEQSHDRNFVTKARQPQAQQSRNCNSQSLPHFWSAESRVDRVVNGIPDRVDRITALGNAVVPQVAYFLAMQILNSQILERSL